MKSAVKYRWRVLLAVIAAVCLAAMPAGAEQGAAVITGKVKDVDLQEKSLVAGSPDGDVVIYIEKDSKITADGRAISLADIKVGMVVKVVYSMAGEDKIAESVGLIQ